MSVRLSEILEHDAPHLYITNRRRLLAFYDALVDALKKGELTPAGGALPSTLNVFLKLLPGEHTLAKRDRELTDWSVENNHEYAAFLGTWRARLSGTTRTPKPRAIAAPLHQAVTRLQALQGTGTKKADLVHAVEVFLDTYTLSQHALRLPAVGRTLPKQLPPEIALDEQKVVLGDDSKGNYVGLVKRPTRVGKAEVKGGEGG